uniref:Uncharacterized protein n=1 Tax=Timema bartmani TaxID=61472 RepID=A0A7R9F660_9NEOP|nr:unnamed protein product [Timema bartmani]
MKLAHSIQFQNIQVFNMDKLITDEAILESLNEPSENFSDLCDSENEENDVMDDEQNVDSEDDAGFVPRSENEDSERDNNIVLAAKNNQLNTC